MFIKIVLGISVPTRRVGRLVGRIVVEWELFLLRFPLSRGKGHPPLKEERLFLDSVVGCSPPYRVGTIPTPLPPIPGESQPPEKRAHLFPAGVIVAHSQS